MMINLDSKKYRIKDSDFKLGVDRLDDIISCTDYGD
jgi:hypothetical protein